MGWLVVVPIKPLIAAVETGGLVLLIAGDSRTLGTAFYVWKAPQNFITPSGIGFVLLEVRCTSSRCCST